MNFKKLLAQRPVVAAASALTALVALGALSTSFLGVGSSQAKDQASPAAAPAVPVSVAVVIERDVNPWSEYSGRLEAVERVSVKPRVAGAVKTVHFREGALVREGDLLITLDPSTYEAEVERAEAQHAAAESRVDQARNEQQRAERLWEQRAIAQRELDERNHALREAGDNLRATRAALKLARLSLSYTQVRAPVSGRVGRAEVTAGNLVSAGPDAPVLTTLVSVNPVYASFDVDEQVVGRALKQLPGGGTERAHLGRIPVRMESLDGSQVEGHIHSVDNRVDTASGTVRVRAVFADPEGQLMPGQFARIRMAQARSTSALLITERALGTDQNRRFVMVVGEDSKAVRRDVTLGASVDGLRMVLSGLKAGERVVVNGLHRVQPGALVASQPVEMDSAAEVRAQDGATPRS